jgi:hypothetical protein
MGMRDFMGERGNKIDPGAGNVTVAAGSGGGGGSVEAWLFSDLHIAMAAERIQELINSRPSSPTADELVNIIKGVKQ